MTDSKQRLAEVEGIDPKQRDALVDFFRQRVVALGSDVAEHPRPPAGADDSYYHSRGGERPRATSMEIDLGSRRSIARALDGHWRGTPLEGLGRGLLRLARLFPRRAEKADVSSDVYEMF